MLLDPPSPEELRLLRIAVAAHVGAERRRAFPILLHAGRPGGPEAVLAHPRGHPLDLALRTDVLEAVLRRAAPVRLVWLTRPGEQDLHDVDLAWAAASRAAAAETGTGHRFVVVTRHGWHDPSSGDRRTWRRLRVDRR